MKAMIKCDNCGNRFTIGNTNGMPNGVTLFGDYGRQEKLSLCQKCIVELGQMNDEQKRAFFEKLKSND